MQSEPYWLTFEEVVELNQFAVASTGEPHGFIDRGAAESALNNCRQHYFYGNQNDIIDLSHILMMSFARSQGFRQGNKRTGFMAARLFLAINGYILDMPDRAWIADATIEAIRDRRFELVTLSVFRAHIREA